MNLPPETPAERRWIMRQFRERPRPTMPDTLTVLRWAALGAGFAVALVLIQSCAQVRDARMAAAIDRADRTATPWHTLVYAAQR